MSTRFTITSASGSSTQDFPNEAPEQVLFEDLQPGTSYSVTAELYYGDTVVDTDTKKFSTPIEYVTDAFYLQNETEEENVLTLGKSGTPRTTDLEYSLDGSSWTAFNLTQSTNTVTIPAAGRVYLRSSTGFSGSSSSRLTMACSKNFSVRGNLQCLHNYKDLSDLTVDTYEFHNLFISATTLISAKYLYLPATTLAKNCYSQMFYGCRSLTEAPIELPATTLADLCYGSMFNSCTSLTTTPELPATTLADSCYSSMFSGCRSLTKAPVLPATTLDSNCYYRMFNECLSLTETPALPATTLASACYREMFRSCTALAEAPVLPATTLASGCYRYMFQYCSALTEAPVLPATTLAANCYGSMFDGCSKLQSVTTYVTEWNPEYTTDWLLYAGTDATNPTVYCPADSTIPSNNASGIPSIWTRADLVTD